ncbi:hypothetical protein [Novosphingobium resinovorum]|uniref:hypothetical protein n=1 Tax=Novosphingobium resinovorum TaxID=158500 RepID=UPI002ED33983
MMRGRRAKKKRFPKDRSSSGKRFFLLAVIRPNGADYGRHWHQSDAVAPPTTAPDTLVHHHFPM